jgi:glucose 1-dehydrogenase
MPADVRPVTIITGAGRGIGAATAVELARNGHDIVVNYVSDSSSADDVVVEALRYGVRALAIAGDVADDDDVAELFERCTSELGQPTGLVCNAGLTAHVGDLADTPVEVVRRVLDVNLLGTVLCARRAVQVMSTTCGGLGGAIVNISSAAATLGSAHEYVHYAAAKAGVDALTVGLAKEVAADGIRVNAVAPGLIRTDIHAAAGDPDRVERVVSRIPIGRAGEPTEVAPAVAWLLGPHSGYVTGTVVRVAGGL